MIEIAQQIINIGKHLFHLRNALLICRNRTDFPQGTADKFRCILSGTAVSPVAAPAADMASMIFLRLQICDTVLPAGYPPRRKAVPLRFPLLHTQETTTLWRAPRYPKTRTPTLFQFPVFLITGGKTLFFSPSASFA